MKKSDQLRSRWKPEFASASNPNIETAWITALHFLDLPGELKQKLSADGYLSPKGVADRYRAEIRKTVTRLKGDSTFAANQRKGVEAQRYALGKVSFDKADAAGALRRMELRQFLKTDDKRLSHLFGADNVEFIQSALEMPPALSGLTAEQMAHVRDGYIQDRHADSLAALQATEEAITAIEQAQQLARKAITEEAGLESQREVNAWWDSIPAV